MNKRTDSPGHETRDAPSRVPLLFMLMSVLLILLGSLLIWGLLHSTWQAPVDTRPPFGEQPQTMAEPAFQQHPAAELEVLNRRMREHLNNAGWIDREAGLVHMPIDRAMDLLVKHGLPASDNQ